jgi:hypothetical protein
MHHDTTLRTWLLAAGRIDASVLATVLAEQERRRADGRPALLEELLLQAQAIDEHDIAAAFPRIRRRATGHATNSASGSVKEPVASSIAPTTGCWIASSRSRC